MIDSRPALARDEADGPPDVVLVGCVKSKLPHRAPARKLYTSALFRKERAHAEATGAPWFILSAEHGLMHPDDELEPYELHLASTSAAYRRAWGHGVVQKLVARLGPLAGRSIEVHAGEAYVAAIRSGLVEAGAVVREPLAGLTMGERLAWYGTEHREPRPVAGPEPVDVAGLVASLGDGSAPQRPAQLLARPRAELQHPGLYSWWVDGPGAEELAQGLQLPLVSGLIYAGQAGATRSKSGKRSSNTLHGRLVGMHLGSKNKLSTFRRSVGSILAEAWGTTGIDEARLSAWMHDHLWVIAIPVADADTLDAVETEVLTQLDPPLNLAKMPKTPVRVRLSELRKRHGD